MRTLECPTEGSSAPSRLQAKASSLPFFVGIMFMPLYIKMHLLNSWPDGQYAMCVVLWFKCNTWAVTKIDVYVSCRSLHCKGILRAGICNTSGAESAPNCSSKRQRFVRLLALSSVWQLIIFFSCWSQGLTDTFWSHPFTVAFPDLVWSYIFSTTRLGWVRSAAAGAPLFCCCFCSTLSPVQASLFPAGLNHTVPNLCLCSSSSSSPPPPHPHPKTSSSCFWPTPELHKIFSESWT